MGRRKRVSIMASWDKKWQQQRKRRRCPKKTMTFCKLASFFLSMQRFNLQSQANMMHVFQCADTFSFSYFLLIWNEKFSIYNSKVFKLFYREARVEVTVVVFYTYVHECDIYFNIIYNSNIFAILSGSDE